MTPPSIERAVEILTAASAARAARSDDQAAQLIAAAIDVVLARLAIARRIEDGLVSWRADVEAATLDHGWQIIDRIDALLAPNRPAIPAPAPPPFAPVADVRLREIAAGEYGPNPKEGKAVAAELLSARNALRYHEEHGRLRTAAQGYLASALRSLLEDLGLAPSGTGSEDLGILELEIKRLRAPR